MLYLVAYYPMLNELVLLGKTFLLYAVKKTTCDRPGNRNGLKPDKRPCPKLFIKRNNYYFKCSNKVPRHVVETFTPAGYSRK